MKAPTTHLGRPFFDDVHRELGARLTGWMAGRQIDENDDPLACQAWVRLLGEARWLRYCVPAGGNGALSVALARRDSRALVILRETLVFHSPPILRLPCRAWAAARSRWQAREASGIDMMQSTHQARPNSCLNRLVMRYSMGVFAAGATLAIDV